MPFVRTSARTAVRRLAGCGGAVRGSGACGGAVRGGAVRGGAVRGGRRRSGGALVLLSVAILAAACTTPAQPGGGQDLTVAVVPGVDTAPLNIAVKDGLFSRQDITVTVKRVQSTADAYNDLRNGTATVAAGDYAAFFYAISTDQSQLKLIADGYDAGTGTMQLLTLPNSPITSPKDLVGKTIGTPYNQIAPYQNNFPYNIQTLATESVLANDGVIPSDVTWKRIPASQMINALGRHQVDAILVSEPQIIEAETELGAVELLDSCSGVTANLPLTGYFSTATAARRDKGALTAFRNALLTAQSDAANRSTIQSALVNDNITAEDAALVNVGQYPDFLNVGQIQRVADLMYSSGMITSPVSVASLVFK
jgi:NitT/TauT family transport system substrate-binding protein